MKSSHGTTLIITTTLVVVLIRGTAGAQQPPAADPKVDENYVLAAVNTEVVTIRDVMLEWRFEARRDANPDRPLAPTREDRLHLSKAIVSDRLWVAHAKENPLYAEFVTPRMIDDETRDTYGALFNDPSLPADERELLRFKGEVRIAMQIALQNDPEFKRCMCARPGDVRRWYDAHPEMHRISAKVQLGRVILSRENAKELYGEAADSLVQKLRQRAVELGSLEAATKEIAPGSYQVTPEYEIDRDPGLLDEVLTFARTAVAGEMSTPVSGQNSVMLFTVLSRKDGEEITFEKAAAGIKRLLENRRCEFRAEQYFILRVLPEAFFRPQELFDDDIEQFIPGFKENRARARAAAAK